MTITINAEKREKTGKLAGLREQGFLPAVFYGKKQEATPIQIKKKEFLKAWKEAGESTVITLHTPEGDLESLIHAVDIDPLNSEPRHADFYVFEKGHKIEVSVPLEFVGVAPAIKELGGSLVKVMHELPIKAMPKDLPHQIEVDISVLKDFESKIAAKDLKLPEGVELDENPEEIVALAEEPREEVEEAPAEEVDLSSIEVEKKGKQEEDDSSQGSVDSSQEEKEVNSK